jgi:hypothetical protein
MRHAILLAATLACANVAAAGLQDIDTLPVTAQGAISSALGRDRPAYHAARDARGVIAHNPRHGLDLAFRRDGLAISTAAGRVGVELQSIGRGSRLEPVKEAVPEARANRIEFARGTVTEWYANGPLGLQQGFTVSAPPGARNGRPLKLTMKLSGPLRPTLDEKSGDVALLDRGGKVALRYRGLTAVDATGATLGSRMRLDGARLSIEVDDSDARYPVVIDPFFEMGKLIASDGLSADHFGAAVAISGNTVVVGADFDDVGANNSQGSAYVFVKPASGWTSAMENAHLISSKGE